jgi:hypothetical protein
MAAAPAPPPPAPAAPAPSPFTTTRGEFSSPSAERADRTAAAPPPARSIQKESPQPAQADNGFFQRDPAREPVREPAAPPSVAIPGDNRLVRPASADVNVSARAAQSGEPLVVPIRLDGSVREIVLRIVIEQAENAENRR